jgi:hypothetical protein
MNARVSKSTDRQGLIESYAAMNEAIAPMITLWDLTWIGAPRPPVHPEPMTGKRTFFSYLEAINFMHKQPDDSKLVSLVSRKIVKEDHTQIATNLLRSLREE